MAQATLSVDGHVHLYPIYDLTRAIENGHENLMKNCNGKAGEKVVPVWQLTERSDCAMFDEISKSPAVFKKDGYEFIPHEDGLTILVRKNSEPYLYIFAGRQLVASEGLEILSLVSRLNIPDREKSIREIKQAIEDSGGIPTLNWAPGKWFFKRGQVIASLIYEYSADDAFIGETTLRHTLWPEPKLIKRAKQKGYSVIAGSDPLPFSGEEETVGTFGFKIKGDFDSARPARSFTKMMKANRNSVELIGRRNNIFTFAGRQYKIMAEKRTRESR
ncbi:MAG: hypothetical protein ACOY90_14480 [Candidatus Zhuqueibacterota bacterium]